MPETTAIRYNDTQEYEYITCFSTHGVFTGKQIDYKSLPQGFCTYYMTAGKDGIVSRILPARIISPKKEIFGTFISKETFPGNTGKLGSAIDWVVDVIVHTDQEFDFEEYFGVPPSLDCQIENAYERQAIQIQEARAKKRGKGKRQQEYHQDLIR